MHDKLRCNTSVTKQGRATTQAVSRRLHTAEARVRSQDSPSGNSAGQGGTGTRVSLNPSAYPCQFHSTVSIYSLMYQPQLYIREVPSSNLGPVTGYPE